MFTMNTPSSQSPNVRTPTNKTGSPALFDPEQRRYTDLGNATIFFTMAVPASSRAHCGAASAALSLFPMRQSSIVNTFKQQQRINIIRMMFHEPPLSHKIPHGFQTSRTSSAISDGCQGDCCKHMGDSSEYKQSRASPKYPKTPSRIRLISGSFKEQRYSGSLSPGSRSQSSQRMYTDSNLQCKTNIDNLEWSPFVEHTNQLARKEGHFVTLYQSHAAKGSKTAVDRYLTTCEDFIKSVKLHKKKQEKNKLMRERLEYHKRTRHILNYYLNEDRDLEDPTSNEQDNTHVLECFLNARSRRPPSSEIRVGPGVFRKKEQEKNKLMPLRPEDFEHTKLLLK